MEEERTDLQTIKERPERLAVSEEEARRSMAKYEKPED